MQPPKYLEESDVVQLLRFHFNGCSVQEMASHLKVSRGYVYDVLKGRRGPGPSILDYLKLEKRVGTTITYMPAEAQEPAEVQE